MLGITLDNVDQRWLMRWIACMLREINLVDYSYINIINPCHPRTKDEHELG
jgi:hypothetical protein